MTDGYLRGAVSQLLSSSWLLSIERLVIL